MLLLASTTTAMVPLPTLLVSALLMPGAMATLHSTAVLWAVLVFTPLVSPTATGPHRVFTSVMPMPRLSATDTHQSSPRDTQAGLALLPQDSSLPVTDAVWASGPLMLMLLTTPRGLHREPTVLDMAVDTTGVK